MTSASWGSAGRPHISANTAPLRMRCRLPRPPQPGASRALGERAGPRSLPLS